MTDIVNMLRAADEWMLVGLEGIAYSDGTPFEAADLIERQRAALRIAREAVDCFGSVASSNVSPACLASAALKIGRAHV